MHIKQLTLLAIAIAVVYLWLWIESIHIHCVTSKPASIHHPVPSQTSQTKSDISSLCENRRSFLGLCVQSLPNNKQSCESLKEWEAVTDYCLFYNSDVGIVEITDSRWKQAQTVESSVWHGNNDGQDRNEQHAAWFDSYHALVPHAHSLGKVLEIGSGPFTQTKTIIEKLGMDNVKINTITLADPLMIFYHKYVPACPYKDGSLLGFPTRFIASGAEELYLRDQYDTVIMINVLEHCRNALTVLENLHRAVKSNGLLVFSERWYDTKWAQFEQSKHVFWDVMHPINVKMLIIDKLLSEYNPLYRKNFYYEGSYPTDEGVYFIGVKKGSV